jgi:2-dehydro-3-deoxyphosphooctonate aldolase (KDO 8-P synthase)
LSALESSNPGKAAASFDIGNVPVDGRKLLFILGPCVIESEDFLRDTGKRIKEQAATLGARLIFKASYDKANRTSVHSFRGIGCRDGCQLLADIGKELNVPVTTDIHSPAEAEIAAEFIDLLQIPAFLCRQTDLIQAAAETGRAVNVKKGQFLAPWDVANIAEKLVHYGNERLLVTERGTTFGYNNLVTDMRSLFWMRQQGLRVIFDATHSVQRPGGLGGATGGDRELAPVLARAAVAAGCDGVFLETHPNPDEAFSDGPNQVLLEEMPAVIESLVQIHDVTSAL